MFRVLLLLMTLFAAVGCDTRLAAPVGAQAPSAVVLVYGGPCGDFMGSKATLVNQSKSPATVVVLKRVSKSDTSKIDEFTSTHTLAPGASEYLGCSGSVDVYTSVTYSIRN